MDWSHWPSSTWAVNSNVSQCEYKETPLPSHNCKDYRGPLSGSPRGQGKSNCWTFALDKTKPETNGRPPWFRLKVELVNNSSVNPFSLLWDLWRKTIKRRWTGEKGMDLRCSLENRQAENTHQRWYTLFFHLDCHFLGSSTFLPSNITQPDKQVDFFSS